MGRDKAPYVAKAAQLKVTFDKQLEQYKAQGGVMTKKRKPGRKLPKDASRPKKPTAGAFGVFLNEKRVEIMRSLPKGFQATDVGKEASKRWKLMGEDEKRPYQLKYEQRMKAYKEAMD